MNIVSKYFDPAKNILDNQLNSSGILTEDAQVYHQYAIFAERQYHVINKSPDVLRWKVYVDRKSNEVERLKGQMLQARQGSKEYGELNQEVGKAEKVLAKDQQQSKEHMQSRTSFFSLAIDMYSRSLQTSDLFDDDAATRFCSLWLANFDNLDPSIPFTEALERIPSHKFVFLAHQLSARLSISPSPSDNSSEGSTSVPPSSPSQGYLRALITRMCREHPYHSLYQVYCLRSETDMPLHRRQSTRHSSPSQLDRGTAAREIFDRLRQEESLRERINAVEQVCSASLQWAQYPIKKHIDPRQKGPLKIPDDVMIKKLHDLPVPVITASTLIDKTLKYEDCVWIQRWESTYSTAGGMNLPKINVCIGVDGRKYKQLVSLAIQSLIYNGIQSSIYSSKGKVRMISDKMRLWSRCSTW